MSQHYTFSLTLGLNNDISTEETLIVDYLFGSNPEAPIALPKHSYFVNGLPQDPVGFQYRDFPKESYSSESWVEKNNKNEIIRRNIRLYLPGQKFEGVFESCLPLASWLATVSSVTGYVGSFSREDIEDYNPTLLFIYKRELFLGGSVKAQSFQTGSRMCFKEVG